MSIEFIRRCRAAEGGCKAEHSVRDREDLSLLESLSHAAEKGVPLLVEKNEWKLNLDNIILIAGLRPEVHLQIVFPDETKLTDSFLEYLTKNYVPGLGESSDEEPFLPPRRRRVSRNSRSQSSEMLSFCIVRNRESISPSGYDLEDDFATTLKRYINERWHGKMNDLYDQVGRTRQAYSKIINGSDTPKRETVFAFIIALELNIGEANDLLMKAGYAFNRSKLYDLIIKEAIESNNYDRYSIDDKLNEFNLPRLPGGVD